MTHPRSLLERLGAKPLRRLSQNFLLSPHWAEKLVAATREGTEPVDEYWEIGPGLGALTERLVEGVTVPVRLFETDRKLAAHLRERFPTAHMHEGDVLEADLAALCQGKRIALLSNLPYQISSPILFRLLPLRTSLVRLVLTFQREFAERLIAEADTEMYGSLSVVIPSAFDIESLGVLPPGAFYPTPDIDSQALLLRPKPSTVQLPALDVLEKLSRAAFAHRRKKVLSNCLEGFPTLGTARWASWFVELGIAANARAEQLPRATFLALAERLAAALAQESAGS